MKELTVEAKRENLLLVQALIDEELEAADCPMATQITIDVAVEELFVNVADYAYDGKTGNVTVRVVLRENPLAAEINFIDSGKQYDPLINPDPDITLSAKDRPKGGLGIFMVKNTMDDMKYEYKDGKNVLTLIKNL